MDLLTKSIALLTAVITAIMKMPELASWWEKRRQRHQIEAKAQPTKSRKPRNWPEIIRGLALVGDTLAVCLSLALLFIVSRDPGPVSNRTLGWAATAVAMFVASSLRSVIRS